MKILDKFGRVYVEGDTGWEMTKQIGDPRDVRVWDAMCPLYAPHRIMTNTDSEFKPTNPKDIIGSSKLPMHLIPASALAFLSIAFAEGAFKYGKYNWRVVGVRSSIYLDALERHAKKYREGEDCDQKTRVHHLASVMACCAIILDAEVAGSLTDDRPPRNLNTVKLIDDLAKNLKHLKETFADQKAYQFTIQDEKKEEENASPSGHSTGTGGQLDLFKDSIHTTLVAYDGIVDNVQQLMMDDLESDATTLLAEKDAEIDGLKEEKEQIRRLHKYACDLAAERYYENEKLRAHIAEKDTEIIQLRDETQAAVDRLHARIAKLEAREISPDRKRAVGIIENHGRTITAKIISSEIMDDWPDGRAVTVIAGLLPSSWNQLDIPDEELAELYRPGEKP